MNTRIIPIILLLVLSVQLNAQMFVPANFGKSMKCTVIYKSGETADLTAKYDHPDILKDPNKPLETSQDGAKSFLDKKSIETFYINNQCWVQRSTPVGLQWVILVRQGPIEHISYITSDGKGVNPNIVTGDLISKDGQIETNTTLVLGYKKKMSQLVSDHKELATKINNGDKGYGQLNYLNVVDEYNVWRQETNPVSIKYYPWFNAGKATSSSVADIIKESRDSVSSASKALASSRPATPAPEIASKKTNLPPKKESFSAKIKRYESDGHKIAVILTEQKTKVLATIRAMSADPKAVGFEGSPTKEFLDPGILARTVSELNKVYNTTIFEAVELSNIPLTEIKSLQADDWWSTCYKTVVSLAHIQQFNCSNDMMTPGNFEGTGSISLLANVFEYIDDGKKSSDVLKRLYVLGAGVSDTFEYTEKDWPITFEKLDTMVDWNQVKQRYEKKSTDQFGKLVSKWD